ncbi:hypothetical protein LCGC14_2102090 [marine sediment metagenome]|uniref:Homing endonuclease LAGLIDADG domain-containing protein n=1 Tax=marine sediment metagenome TaxID=412755 RepID=A0A0F9E9H4_9ZZZZ
MIKLTEIAWLAGLLEGEGYFALYKKKYPVIRVTMTDEDTIIKAANIWKANTEVYHYKNLWRTEITGALAIQWMMTLFPYLGERRREAVTEVVKFWRAYSHMRSCNGLQIRASCHPDRPASSFGLCRSCYQREWREKRKLLRGTG